ncbi:MAG: AtpZ/AtpI family protein [Pseudomonadota bacterium]
MTDPIDDLQNRIQTLKKETLPIESASGTTPNEKSDANKGYELLGTPIVCGGIGLGLDKVFSTSPIFFISLAILGVLAAFWSIFKAERNIITPLDSKRLQDEQKTAIKAAISDKSSEN